MSEPEDEAGRPRRTQSITHRTRWPGWIWAVPIAAVAIVAWLLARDISSRGIRVSVTFDTAAGMQANATRVSYLGIDIGTVSGVAIAKDGRHVIAQLDIDRGMARYLTSGTRFYLEGASRGLFNAASLKAIVSGPEIVMMPGGGPPARHYHGITGGPPPGITTAAVHPTSYLVRFDGDVGGLRVGSPVKLRGFTVGQVASVRLTTDAATGEVRTPVVLTLDPARFHIHSDAGAGVDWTALMNSTLAALIGHGLRARLTQSPPLIGAPEVELAFVPGAAKAALRTGASHPEIPTVEDAGLGHLLAAAGKLPIGEIGANVRSLTARLDSLLGSPQLQDAIDHLDRTLATLDRTAQQAGPQVAPTLASLRRTIDALRATADDMDATAAAARRVMGGSPASPNGNVQQALRELTEAARSVRALANYLDQHPESLIRGR